MAQAQGRPDHQRAETVTRAVRQISLSACPGAAERPYAVSGRSLKPELALDRDLESRSHDEPVPTPSKRPQLSRPIPNPRKRSPIGSIRAACCGCAATVCADAVGAATGGDSTFGVGRIRVAILAARWRRTAWTL